MSDIKVESIEIKRDCVHVVFLGLPNVPGVAAEVFRALAEHGVGVDMATQNTMRGGRSDLSFLIRRDRLDEVIPLCRQVSDKAGGQGVSFATEVAVLSVLLGQSDAAAMSQALSRMFSALAGAGVNIEIINSALASVVCLISSTRAEEGFAALKEAFKE
ncbi:MAG: ACT domain-containing protein [Synergistaceae bacterium]|nr:ACT domain-containing protein [Synergistaceae bacterium]